MQKFVCYSSHEREVLENEEAWPALWCQRQIRVVNHSTKHLLSTHCVPDMVWESWEYRHEGKCPSSFPRGVLTSVRWDSSRGEMESSLGTITMIQHGRPKVPTQLVVKGREGMTGLLPPGREFKGERNDRMWSWMECEDCGKSSYNDLFSGFRYSIGCQMTASP